MNENVLEIESTDSLLLDRDRRRRMAVQNLNTDEVKAASSVMAGEIAGNVLEENGPPDDGDDPGEAILPGREDEDIGIVIADVQQRYREWEAAAEGANRRKRALLGRIYEAVPMITAGSCARSELVAAIRKRPDIVGSNRWNPDRKSPEELFLALLFGVDKQRSTKSQWLAALRGAASAEVDRGQLAFIDYMNEVGGIDGAGKEIRAAKNPSETAERFARSLAELKEELGELGIEDDRAEPVEVPKPFGGDPFPEGLGVMLFRQFRTDQASGALLAVPLQTCSDPALVIRVMEHLQRERVKVAKDGIAELRGEKRKERSENLARLRSTWLSDKKARRTRLNYADYKAEWGADFGLE